jgi:hypothetical protein
MKSMLALAALASVALALPAAAVANQPDVRLSSMDPSAEDRAAEAVARQLLAATTVEFVIDLPDDYVSLDPDYDPLAGWTPD